MRCNGDHGARRSELARSLLDRQAGSLRRTARRYSLCAEDAEDALQAALEIFLAKAPLDAGPRQLAGWMHVVIRREALAMRRLRTSALGGARSPGAGIEAIGNGGGRSADAALGGRDDGSEPAAGTDRCEALACERPGPAERIERRERVAEVSAALATLKPAERRALGLLAAGLSYAEICELTGWTYTKVNRSLSEGRARLRELALQAGRSAAGVE